MDDLKLRDRLAGLADDVPPQTIMPVGLARRAHRRAAVVLAAVVVSLILAVVGLSAGVRAVLRSEDGRPARPPDPPGTIMTVVGTGELGTDGVGGPAAQAQLTLPVDVAFDRNGNMYIAEKFASRVLKVDVGGTLSVVAGDGGIGFAGDGGRATEAKLSGVTAVAVDATGDLYIADVYNDRIRMVDRDGIITTVAGTGRLGFSGDGGLATDARLDSAFGMAFDAEGHLYFQDTGNNVVRKVDLGGTITTVAGTGLVGEPAADGTPATDAPLGPTHINHPMGLEFDREGRLFITDFGHSRIWMIDERGLIHTVAGNGGRVFSGEGGLATEASIGQPLDVAIGPDGRLYISAYEFGIEGGVVWMVDLDGTITKIAGTGEGGYSGDGGPATRAEFNIPAGIAIGPDGNLYIADAINNVIRMVVL